MGFTGTTFKFVNVYAKNSNSAVRKAKKKVSQKNWRVHSTQIFRHGIKRKNMYPAQVTFAKRKRRKK